jgi:hypothetical protein
MGNADPAKAFGTSICLVNRFLPLDGYFRMAALSRLEVVFCTVLLRQTHTTRE